MANWHIEGQYMETCNCAFICPCITSNLTAVPTEGNCKVAIAMKIDKGEKDGVKLDGLSVVAVLYSPGAMAEGNFKVGLIIDENADDAQTAAIGEIISGAAGGPMAALAPLVGEMAGIEKRPITFESSGMTYTVKAGELVDQAIEGVASASVLAKATRSSFHAFGIDWDDASGTRNGHFAPFSWAG